MKYLCVRKNLLKNLTSAHMNILLQHYRRRPPPLLGPLEPQQQTLQPQTHQRQSDRKGKRGRRDRIEGSAFTCHADPLSSSSNAGRQPVPASCHVAASPSGLASSVCDALRDGVKNRRELNHFSKNIWCKNVLQKFLTINQYVIFVNW